MKKQFTAILTAAFLLSTFTGCSTAPTSSDSEISDSQPEVSSSSKKIYSTSSLTDSFSLPPKVDSEPEDIIEFDYYYPDGTQIDTSQAEEEIYDNFKSYKFSADWGYVRYAKPIFRSSFDEPELHDYVNSEEFKSMIESGIDDPNYFIIKQGDVLPNGLVVKKIENEYACNGAYVISEDGTGIKTKILQGHIWKLIPNIDIGVSYEFDGEITVEGILSKSQAPNGDYIDNAYSLRLDVSKYNYMIIPWLGGCSGFPRSSESLRHWYGNNFALVHDGNLIYVNFSDGDSEEVSRWFSVDDEHFKVRVTLSDYRISIVQDGGWGNYTNWANIVSCELIDG